MLISLLSNLKSDLFSGIVVFLVALPLCLGIATASGVEPFAGLISGIVGGLVVALLSGSRLSVSGPAAGLVVIVVEAIAQLGSFSAFLTAVLLAGCLQLLLGIIKAGNLAAYIPSSVIKGMLAAIGILLIINQFPLAVGLNKHESNGLDASLVNLSTPFGYVSLTAIVISIVGLGILFAWNHASLKRFTIIRSVPAPLVVVLAGVTFTWLLDAFAPHLAPRQRTVFRYWNLIL